MSLPPLRDRSEDIPMLVDHFIGRMNRLHGRSVTGISQEALSLLMFHGYPGNIRELENIIEHAFVLCPTGEIGLACLPESLQAKHLGPSSGLKMAAAVQSTQAQIIMDTLKRNHFNRVSAARELNIHKSTLYRIIKRIGIQLPKAGDRNHLDQSK